MWKIDTPIVRSTDGTVSILHLTSIVVTISTLLFLNFIGKLTTIKCVLSNLTLSILYVINIGFVYTKSQKLLTAFNANIRLSRSEIRQTSTVQAFTVIIFLLIANAIATITFTQEAPALNSWLDDNQMLRIHYCNTNHHTNIMISFVTLLQMFCFLQAYRGRHLPGPMNNAMSLLYAILIVTVNFLITFPIVHFLDHADRVFAHLIVLVINCTVIVSLLYGYKCYIILFRPQKNTREYFQRQRMKLMVTLPVPPLVSRASTSEL